MSFIPRALVIGFPIGHSRSPLIHGFWLKTLNISGIYNKEEVAPGTVGAFLKALPGRGIAGANITVPHKEEAFAACDRLTDRARLVRAVNTVWFEDGVLVGDNTDGIGFLAHLDATHPSWDSTHPRIVLLGAGGAARGIAAPLAARAPREIVIVNRSRDRAEALAADLRLLAPAIPVRAADWQDRAKALAGCDLLINTTSLGMKGKPPLELDLSPLDAGAIVADIVYVPLETPLLAAARARGLRALDGLGMLLHQAAPGFARWFGVMPPVSEDLRAHIVADLAAKA